MDDVDGWFDGDDPAALRARLDIAVERAELLEVENLRLRVLLEQAGLGGEQLAPRHTAAPLDRSEAPMQPAVRRTLSAAALPPADRNSPPDVKLALFRTLFAGRDDVYATAWVSAKSGRKGWSPAEVDPFGKRPEADRQFLPLTDDVLARHLSKPQPDECSLHAGLYPMLTDDTCRLLACDFDDGTWREDAASYCAAATAAGVPVAVEISRSGDGAHVWTFFTGPVPAAIARMMGPGCCARRSPPAGG
jgi:hypothetical protein